MGLAEVIIGFIGVLIAVWALTLQRKQIIKNSKINSLVHLSSLLSQRIEFHSKIIDNLDAKKENWKGHAEKINNELRPLKDQIDSQLIDIASLESGMPTAAQIKDLVISNNNES